MGEILETFPGCVTWYNMGSTIEGTATPGAQSDNDVIICDESFPVIEDISNAIRIDGVLFSLLIVRELDTPDGYVKLQLVNEDIAYTCKHWTNLSREYNMNLFKIDRMGRIVLSECMRKADPRLLKRTKNKPADLTIGKLSDLKTDTVLSYRSKLWPVMATEWLHRRRFYGWPTNETIVELKSLGFFVVRKGHPFSSEIDLEWRISLSLQERNLMFNLTDVQHKCYVILKMVNRDVINFDCITTYHWKTCLFYAIEENTLNIWKKNRLWYCIKLCIRLMLKWVKCGFCPNYFIPGENLFDGRLNSSWRLISEQYLEEILNIGCYSLLLVRKNNVCDYVRSRGSLECFQRLQANSTKVFLQALCVARISIIYDAIKIFNYEILENNSWRANNNTFIFIN
ncbi:uncharacterized protein LOC127721206 [Mytilus californianus]|uniref:uncharacterized protein LOC127721206 n=1 Tax=Mytilus californianus TaxID=6549 RepID=UPI002245F0A8|nr:uncharacterized protein LOC127721206 [Mytilus californianus]